MEPTARTKAFVIVAGGDLATTITAEPHAVVIAADSGYDHAVGAGLTVDLLIGDMDSVSPTGRAHAEASSVEVVAFPADKDHTDLELALRAAVDRGATSVEIFGGEGGSIGHLLAGALALTSEVLAGITLRWHVATGVVTVARPGHPVDIDGSPGDRVTIVPIGTVEGVRTTGLRWHLDGERLDAGSTRGVSNELEGARATVRLDSGIALVIAEGA